MIIWLAVTNFFFNLVCGAMIPITPALNEKMAGVGFSVLSLFKSLFFIPSGWYADRFGYRSGLGLALIVQLVALFLLWHFPGAIWIIRSLEGLSLALGMVSALALARIYAPDSLAFGRAVRMLLAGGGIGFLIGPVFGFSIPPTEALQILFVISFGLCLFQFLKRFSAPVVVEAGPKKSLPISLPKAAGLYFLMALALSKGLNAGIQPNLGWWSTHILGLSRNAAGLFFMLAGFGFVVGTLLNRRWVLLSGAIGFAMIVFALENANAVLWGASLFTLGIFLGHTVQMSLKELGWTDSDSLGVKNAKWLLISDSPMMIAPLIFWEWRGSEALLPALVLLAIGITLTAISLLMGMKRKPRS